jgi:hypothetical protein
LADHAVLDAMTRDKLAPTMRLQRRCIKCVPLILFMLIPLIAFRTFADQFPGRVDEVST